MSTEPIRPPTKANSTNRKDWRCFALAVAALCIWAVPVLAQSCTPSPSCMNPQFNLSAYYGGQNITINQCIDPNSPSCAWADAVMVPNMADATKYFLACQLLPGTPPPPIALCYYSGVPGAPLNTPSCTLSQGGNAAECSCYEINATTPGATGQYSYSYVELTAILNQDLYNQTLADCVGSDGTINCLTLADVHNGIMKPQAQHLCAALTNQPNGIFPGADLVSDFSEIGNSPENPGIPAPLATPYACPANPPPPGNNYAACMTAPCTHTGKIDPVTHLALARCTCPTFIGPNQVGNPQIENPPNGPPFSCSPTGPPYGPTALPWVWSSAYIETTN
jgi:hypothetical protein